MISSWSNKQWTIFTVTFASHALLHAVRKNLSNVKKTLSKLWVQGGEGNRNDSQRAATPSNYLFETAEAATFFLAFLDTAFIIMYAFGEFVSGILGDRFSLKNLLCVGMLVSSISAIFFGTVSEWIKFYNYYWYAFWWSITGLFQSTGWPIVIAIIGNWFKKSTRGFVMGIIGVSASVGNILGSYAAHFLLDYGYEYVFLVPSLFTFLGGIAVYVFIASCPQDIGLPTMNEDSEDIMDPPEENCKNASQCGLKPKKPINFYYACKIPGVLEYSISFACLKMVSYSLFSWLPYYLQDMYGWTEKEAILVSIWFDVGGIIGAVASGIISDSVCVRSPVVGVFLLLTPGSLYGFYALSTNHFVVIFFMTLTGIATNGASNLISTAIAADLGRTKKFCKGNEALCTVTGIINGTGSTGAALGQLLIPFLIDKNTHKPDWFSIFEIFIIMCCLTFLLLSKIVYEDTKILLLKDIIGE